jgi:hypothetical protein
MDLHSPEFRQKFPKVVLIGSLVSLVVLFIMVILIAGGVNQ